MRVQVRVYVRVQARVQVRTARTVAVPAIQFYIQRYKVANVVICVVSHISVAHKSRGIKCLFRTGRICVADGAQTNMCQMCGRAWPHAHSHLVAVTAPESTPK